jgi:hypothetical protein
MKATGTGIHIVLASMLAYVGSAVAQNVVIPPANENVQGTSSVVTMFNTAARSFQWVIPGQDLALVPGTNTIEGFRARTRSTAAVVPSADQNYANFDISIGELAVPLGVLLNPSFPDNSVPGTEVSVRSGPLTIPAGSFPTGGAPNLWGPLVEFDQAFVFDPARNYIITVRHTGGVTGGSPGMDANTNSGDYRGQFVSSYTGTVASSTANYTIVQLQLGSGAPVCYANCDGSTVAPVLNVDDFTCFINEFASAQGLPHEQQVVHYANCDNSTVAPALNVDDFTCFINAFAQGCP